MKKIEMLRHRNIKLQRREKGDVLTVGEDLTGGQADTLVRIGNAKWVAAKKKAHNPAKENKSA